MGYTVNDSVVAEQLLRWGVDGLITDAIDRVDGTQGSQLR